MDVDNIPPGADFREHLVAAIERCDALLAVIGDNWGQRLFDSRDFVRVEIESALKKGLQIIPLLVGDVSMPTESDVPAEIREFVYRNAEKIDPGRDFHYHMDRLIRHMTMLNTSLDTSAMDQFPDSEVDLPKQSANACPQCGSHKLDEWQGELRCFKCWWTPTEKSKIRKKSARKHLDRPCPQCGQYKLADWQGELRCFYCWWTLTPR